MGFFKTRKRKLFAFGAVAILCVVLWSFCVWREEISMWLLEVSRWLESVSSDVRGYLSFLDGLPLIFYSLAIFVLPIICLPVTPIFVVAASRAVEDSYLVVLLYCYFGVTMNIIASYFISKRFGMFVRKKLAARGVNVPDIPEYEQYELTFLMRMIPGNPLAVQNYVLGAANIPFFKYVVVSLPIQFIQIAAYVWFGEGILNGQMSKFMLGVSVLFVIAVIARMLDKRYGYKLRGKKNGISKK